MINRHCKLVSRAPSTSHHTITFHTVVCEINTHLGPASLFNVSTSLPFFTVGPRFRGSGLQQIVFISLAGCSQLAHVRDIGHEGGQGQSDKDHM